MENIKKLYENHHAIAREEDFSIMKNERAKYFCNLIGTGKKILDIGCRDGALTHFFIKGNDVTGIDIDEVALKRAAEKGINVKVMDIYGDWSVLLDQKFDVIVAGEVLEHLYYPDRIVTKIYEHLSQGGIFIGSVPNAFSLKNRFRLLFGNKKNTPLEDPTHINHFGVKDIIRLLKDFKETKVGGLGRYVFLAKTFPKLLSFDLVFHAKK